MSLSQALNQFAQNLGRYLEATEATEAAKRATTPTAPHRPPEQLVQPMPAALIA